ncbi:MAG TPA: hypothetical protein VN901_19940 [Candidatus Acidoferrales bacterium]|nr:hypothetical protein [Candidatus Acidoferrales bacterium]
MHKELEQRLVEGGLIGSIPKAVRKHRHVFGLPARRRMVRHTVTSLRGLGTHVNHANDAICQRIEAAE